MSSSSSSEAAEQASADSTPLVMALRVVGSFTHPVSAFAFECVQRSRRLPNNMQDDSARFLLGRKTDDFGEPGTATPLTHPVTFTISGRLCRDDVRFETRGRNGVTLVGLWMQERSDILSHVEWREAADTLHELSLLADDDVDTDSAFRIEASGALKLRFRSVRVHTSSETAAGFAVYEHDGREIVVADASRLPYDRELTAEFQLLCYRSDSRSPEPRVPLLLLLLRKLVFD